MKEYRGMYKYYFDLKSKTKAEKMAADLRSGISAVTPDFNIYENPAFVIYCDEILRELSVLHRNNLEIERLSEVLPPITMRQFLRQAIIEEIHQTNELESIQSTRKEISEEMSVIENGKKSKRFDGMIRKYQLLLTKETIPLSSCQDIRNLYDSFILDEVIKEDPNDAPDGLYFRKSSVSVMKKGRVIHEGIMPESALNSAMEQALKFLNDDDFDPLIRTSAFHYMFGYIHPFYNGNGRMTRFISSYMLTSNDIHILASLRLSYVIKSHRSEYYEMFKTTNDRRNYGDMTRFVITFLKYISEACSQVRSYLQEKQNLLTHYTEILESLNLNDEAKKILFILVQVSVCDSESDGLSIGDIARIVGISRYLVNRNLAELKAFCSSSKKGTSTLFHADLEALDGI